MQAPVAEMTALSPLPHITEVQPLGEADHPLVQGLVQVLEKYDALKRFGLALLHEHFPTSPDEILVEETDVVTRVQTIQPQKKSRVRGLYVATILRLDLDALEPVAVCICANYGSGHQHWQR